MRKLWILMALVAIASNAGCCGSIRNLFRRGAPCGTTTLAPAALGAPMTMAPTAPCLPVCQPMCVPCCPETCCPPCEDPCNPCGQCNECTSGMSWDGGGYYGGFPEGSSNAGGVISSGPVYDGQYMQAPTMAPPTGGGNYRDPGPASEQ